MPRADPLGPPRCRRRARPVSEDLSWSGRRRKSYDRTTWNVSSRPSAWNTRSHTGDGFTRTRVLPGGADWLAPISAPTAMLALNELYARRGVRMDPEHHAWAREVLGVAAPAGPVS